MQDCSRLCAARFIDFDNSKESERPNENNARIYFNLFIVLEELGNREYCGNQVY